MKNNYDVVIVGAGSGGVSVAASLLKRDVHLKIALIDPSNDHFYQPGWTMVGGGVFDASSTKRSTASVIPKNVTWIQQAVTEFMPDLNQVLLDNDEKLSYAQLVVCPGLKLDWDGIEGLSETLGKNGVTSNYRYDLAPYTWQLVNELKSGTAIFTQPPMPIKCAGAPQKAMYLSCSQWVKSKVINDMDVHFYNSGAVLFGVSEYVPALMSYIEKYNANLHFTHTLTKVDGPNKTAWFTTKNESGEACEIEVKFDMLHVCPPQCAPDFIKNSPLTDDAGWVSVDKETLQHTQYSNIWGLGDVTNTPNAKTMAAVRKQAPVVATNIIDQMKGNAASVVYDGYGSCPLTVEHGKIVLAEFTYGGKVAPSFPNWLNNGTKATKLAWTLKASWLPSIYWDAMLKGREWMVKPHSKK